MARKRRKKHRAPEPQADAETRSRSAPERINNPFADALAHMKPAQRRPETVEKAPKKQGGRGAKGREPAAKDAPQPPPSAPRAGAKPRAKPAPPGSAQAAPDYSYEDRVAFQQAYAGVQPLGRRRSEPIRDPGVAFGSGRSGGEEAGARGGPTAAERAGDDQARARLAALVGGGVTFEVEHDPDGRIEALRQGAHPSNLRSLAERGVTPEATLDLHGETEQQAAARVARFVRDRHRRGDRVLRIVHGKGRHSPGGVGVLSDAVRRALTDGGAAPMVLAFATAPARLGGTGAVLVRLVAR